MRNPVPNVVPARAAADARAFVFERRAADAIDPESILSHLLGLGHGDEIAPEFRRKRLRTWTRQVLRRLGKYGWLDESGPGSWSPTASLRGSRDAGALARRAPRRSGTQAPPPPSRPQESWPDFVQGWVFRHRESTFGVGEIAAAMVQHGYGAGAVDARLDAARPLAEQELRFLQEEGLLRRQARSETWKPTELLRTWPAAEGSGEPTRG
jgi:hypothetical protein